MSWKCFLVKSLRYGDWVDCPGGGRTRSLLYTLEDGREVNFEQLAIGAMWHSDQLPPDYQHRGEPSLCVVLPGKNIWWMHRKGSDGSVWKIAGTPPNVTAEPSINYVGRYHGWVKDGVVTDDCEGRRFDGAGKLISS